MEINDNLINKKPAYGRLINSEVIIQHVNGHQYAKVIQISIDPDDTVSGEYDDNPMLKFMVCDV